MDGLLRRNVGRQASTTQLLPVNDSSLVVQDRRWDKPSDKPFDGAPEGRLGRPPEAFTRSTEAASNRACSSTHMAQVPLMEKMRQILLDLVADHGTVRNYLASIGIGAAVLADLQARLTA